MSRPQVGVFTYSHEVTFNNWKITDLTDPSAITDYCDGVEGVECDNQRGDASTGLCMGVPLADICEDPVGATQVDTTDLANFDYVEDPLVTDGPCEWVLDATGNIRQISNADAVNSNLVQGCSANVKNLTVVDFLMQVDFDNDDNDVAGLNFGWRSIEDYFRMHKHNDGWPNPSADLLPGPIMKVLRKMPDVPCDIFDPDYTNTCYQTLAFIAQNGAFHAGLPVGAVAPSEYSRVYIPFSQADIKRVVLMVKGNQLRAMYEDLDVGKVVANFVFDMSPYNYTGGGIGLFTAAHQATFSNFFIADLTGPNAVTEFCNGGLCDSRTGLCLTSPTQQPTSRSGSVVAPDVCPGPVGGNRFEVDVTDINSFTLIDQFPITEPCQWTANATGLSQGPSNAWGNDPGDNTLMGCIALVAGATYTDFIAEFTSTHLDDDSFGFVFGYDSKGTDAHWMAMAINDHWPRPAADGVEGPFIKIKKTNGKPWLPNMDFSNNCYDTLSYTDMQGRYVVDGESPVDLPGEYLRKYPYGIDMKWPETTMTLIVKDGTARVMFRVADMDLKTPVNNIRQGHDYTTAMSYDLGADYVGGGLGIFVYAHQLTVSKFTITDLSDASNLPTAYCDGSSDSCDTTKGLCVATPPVADVCMDPVGGVNVDTTDISQFQIIDDPFLGGACEWYVRDVGTGRGAQLLQSSNANRAGTDYTYLGCTALLRGYDAANFLFQFDADNFDNDGVGMIFGYRSEKDHWKIVKVNDNGPSPAADSVQGPNMKIMRRRGFYSCGSDPMDYSNDCYETIAFIDGNGVFHQGMDNSTVAPWEYSRTYVQYTIGNGVQGQHTRMALMVRDQQLRVMFQPDGLPKKTIGLFAFDLSPYNFNGGRVGVFTWAHQVQFWSIKYAPLDGTVTEFCSEGGVCNVQTGLCDL